MISQDDLIRELEEVLKGLEDGAERCRKQLLRIQEAGAIISKTETRVKQLLPPDSDSFRIFEREIRAKPLWWKQTTSGYVETAACRHFEDRIALLNTILDEIAPEFLRRETVAKSQFYFAAGDAYRAKKKLFSIMKTATASIAIVDSYLDDQVFDYIDSLSDTINIRLLTGSSKPIFRTLYSSLKTKRVNIEARKCDDCHDRFIVLNGNEVWHLGASINGFGTQAFMINKVIDETEKMQFLSDLENWWKKGEQI